MGPRSRSAGRGCSRACAADGGDLGEPTWRRGSRPRRRRRSTRHAGGCVHARRRTPDCHDSCARPSGRSILIASNRREEGTRSARDLAWSLAESAGDKPADVGRSTSIGPGSVRANRTRPERSVSKHDRPAERDRGTRDRPAVGIVHLERDRAARRRSRPTAAPGRGRRRRPRRAARPGQADAPRRPRLVDARGGHVERRTRRLLQRVLGVLRRAVTPGKPKRRSVDRAWTPPTACRRRSRSSSRVVGGSGRWAMRTNRSAWNASLICTRSTSESERSPGARDPDLGAGGRQELGQRAARPSRFTFAARVPLSCPSRPTARRRRRDRSRRAGRGARRRRSRSTLAAAS